MKNTTNINRRIDDQNIATKLNQTESGTSNVNTSIKEQNIELKNEHENLTSENVSIKYNMVQIHTCSTELHQWKNENGISADVYHLIDPNTRSVSFRNYDSIQQRRYSDAKSDVENTR